MSARGTITGLTRGTGVNHIVRAALEAIAYQTDDLLKAMASDSGWSITSLNVDGGASANGFLMQFQADISDLPVFRPSVTETTAAGAAYLAGLAVGFYESRDEILKLDRGGTVFKPNADREKCKRLLDGWHNAVKAARL